MAPVCWITGWACVSNHGQHTVRTIHAYVILFICACFWMVIAVIGIRFSATFDFSMLRACGALKHPTSLKCYGRPTIAYCTVVWCYFRSIEDQNLSYSTQSNGTWLSLALMKVLTPWKLMRFCNQMRVTRWSHHAVRCVDVLLYRQRFMFACGVAKFTIMDIVAPSK